jgi:predicted nucleotidyltransferase
MDLSHPLRSVVPSLDGPVLEVLAATSRPLSGREVAKLAGRGSPSGIRLVLQRLAEHGLVKREDRASAVYYLANRDHLAWPAIQALILLDRELERRIKSLVDGWKIQPVTLAIFGSAARHDGSASSDIDLLLVEPPGVADLDAWAWQRDHLAEVVENWTGNSVQIYNIDHETLTAHVDHGEPIVAEWRRQARTITGHDIRDLLRRATR